MLTAPASNTAVCDTLTKCYVYESGASMSLSVCVVDKEFLEVDD